jgi:hypothetical protein
MCERRIGRQREEIESDVAAEDRIGFPVWHAVDETKRQAPIAKFADGDEEREGERRGRDEIGPRRVGHEVRDHVGKRLAAARVLRKRQQVPGASASSVAQRHRSRHPEAQA